MDHLLAKLLLPFAVLLGTSALGIAVLAVGARRRPSEEESAAALPARGGAGAGFNRSILEQEEHDPHDTLVIDRRALRDSMAGLPQLRARGPNDLRGPDAQLRGARPDDDSGRFDAGPGRRTPDDRRDAARNMRESGVFGPSNAGQGPEKRPDRPARDAAIDASRRGASRDSGIFDPPPRPATRDAESGRGGMFDPPARPGPRDAEPQGRGARDSGIFDPPPRPATREPDAPQGRGARDSGIFDPPARRRDPSPPASPADRARPIDLTRQSADRSGDAGRARAGGRDPLEPGSRPRPPADDADEGGLFAPPSRRRDEPPARPTRRDLDDDLRDAPPERTLRAQRDMFDSPSARPSSRRDTPPEAPRRGEGARGRGDIFDEAPPPRPTRSLRDDDRPTGDSGRLPREPQGRPRDTGMLDGQRRIPMERGGAPAERRLEPVGVNIVLQQPATPRAFLTLPGKLEVIYGNFSPSDPREIPLYWPVGDNTMPRFVFSKSPGDTVNHIQLSHYTITPTVQADLTFENGRHTLGNLVDGEEMDRYQIRVNGVPMGLGERLVLHSGDIISMGIYRLKLIV